MVEWIHMAPERGSGEPKFGYVLLNLHVTFHWTHWTSAQFPFLRPLWNKKGLPYQLGTVPQSKAVSEFPHTNLTWLHYKKNKTYCIIIKNSKKERYEHPINTEVKYISLFKNYQVLVYATRVQHINNSNSVLFKPQKIKIMNLSNIH